MQLQGRELKALAISGDNANATSSAVVQSSRPETITPIVFMGLDMLTSSISKTLG